MMEVSAAYFSDFIDKSGTYGDKDYERIAVNFRPDHIALLTDEPGACSLEDGCGALRTFAAVERLDKLLNINQGEPAMAEEKPVTGEGKPLNLKVEKQLKA